MNFKKIQLYCLNTNGLKDKKNDWKEKDREWGGTGGVVMNMN